MQGKGAHKLFLNPEQAVVRESRCAHRGQCQLRGQQGHSLAQHDPGQQHR